MKIHGLLLAAAFLPVALAAQEDRYAQITNPKLTSINKEPPRSTFTSYTNEADAVVNDRKNGTFRISLNGKWKFNYVENFADRPTDFMDIHADVSKWPDIDVPGNWELQGFGTPVYVNQSYEFCSPGYAPYWDKPNPPYVPKEWISASASPHSAQAAYRLSHWANMPPFKTIVGRSSARPNAAMLFLPSFCANAAAAPARNASPMKETAFTA